MLAAYPTAEEPELKRKDPMPFLSYTPFFFTGSSAMFYLAAAVSDFYIPVSEMPEHKIHSSGGPLQVMGSSLPQI